MPRNSILDWDSALSRSVCVPRPEIPGLRVNYDRTRFNQISGKQRQRGENGARRIAPGIRHEFCRSNLVSIKFRQTVNRALYPHGVRVLDMVPSLIRIGIVQTVIRTEINNAKPLFQNLRYIRHRNLVGDGKNDHIHPISQRPQSPTVRIPGRSSREGSALSGQLADRDTSPT